jgi:ParB family chromosome partitioning protein
MATVTKNKKTAIDAPRGTIYVMNPDDVTIVNDEWLKKNNLDSHPLHDKRRNYDIEESMVKGMMVSGVKKPIIVSKHGEELLVADGRQRVLHAREANRLLEERGEPRITIKVLLEKGSEEDLITTMIITNEHVKPDNLSNKAEKAARLYARTADIDVVAMAFKVSDQSIKKWLELATATDSVKSAVDAQQLTLDAAVKLSKLTPAEQDEKVRLLLEANEGNKRGGVDAAAVDAALGKTVIQKPTPRVLKEYAEENVNVPPEFKLLFNWMRGKVPVEQVREVFPWM